MRSIVRAIPAGLLVLALQAGCDDSTASNPVITATAVASSDSQSALVGTTLPRPLRLQVRSNGVGLPGAVVVWEPSSGGLTISSSATDSDGVASARWTLGDTPGPAVTTATVQGAKGPPAQFHATVLGWVTAFIERASNNQQGVVGDALSRELRLQAFSAGTPAEGVVVTWTTSDGVITPRTALTDARGWASATWTLPRVPGVVQAQAILDRTNGIPLVFRATATPGAAVAVQKYLGDGQSVPANFPTFADLVVQAVDRFGNPAAQQDFRWSVQSGPVAIVPPDTGSTIRLVPTGSEGEGVVRVTLQGTALVAEYTVTATAPVTAVLFDGRFVSAQNGTVPAVDTIAAGTSITWVYAGPCYYCYGDYRVTSVGSPSFVGGDFEFPQPLRFTANFAMPGTYHYAADEDQAITGTVVVR